MRLSRNNRNNGATLEKCYVSDAGMRNAVLGISSRKDISRQIENIVYLELIRRGYEIAVGKYGDKEAGFTARKGREIHTIAKYRPSV